MINHFRTVIGTAISLTLVTAVNAQTVTRTVEIPFTNHIAAEMIEVDVFVEGDGGVWRVNAKEAPEHMASPIYRTANPVEHAPMDESKKGPYPKGEAIGMTLKDWLTASGSAVVTCTGDRGKVEAEFANLVPNGVYTMWYWLVAVPLPAKFHTYDLPVGARDGSQSIFTADDKGNAQYSAPVEPCLQGSGKQFDTGLAIAYHSDGKTYGYSPGDFGNRAHVHLFNTFPKDSDM